MEAKMIISDITHEDLVNLFSTALYGSSNFTSNYSQKDFKELEHLHTEYMCYEDKLALLLLNGKSIKIIDLYGEGENYGNLPFEIDEDEDVIYTVTLSDIKKGLQCPLVITEVKELFFDKDGDEETANCILQAILFDEIIY